MNHNHTIHIKLIFTHLINSTRGSAEIQNVHGAESAEANVVFLGRGAHGDDGPEVTCARVRISHGPTIIPENRLLHNCTFFERTPVSKRISALDARKHQSLDEATANNN